LNAQHNQHISQYVGIRTLFAIVLALAVLIAPGVAGAAMAASSHQDMRMMEAGHCDMPPSSSGDHGKAPAKSCCIAMCTALAVAPTGRVECSPPQQQITQSGPPKAYHGTLTEIATPPPRHA
jgi:hypothetical protein